MRDFSFIAQVVEVGITPAGLSQACLYGFLIEPLWVGYCSALWTPHKAEHLTRSFLSFQALRSIPQLCSARACGFGVAKGVG
jgi:hypothetical protein